MKSPFYFLFFTFLFFVACKEDEVPMDPASTDPCINVSPPNSPGHTNLLTSSKFFGEEDQQYVFERLIDSGDDHLYYTGVFNDNSTLIRIVVGEGGEVESWTENPSLLDKGVGKLTKSGSVVWSKSPGIFVSKISTVQTGSSSLIDNALMVSGQLNTNGVIKIYDADGAQLISYTLNGFQFNDAIFIGESAEEFEFIGVGAFGLWPFVHRFDVNKNDLTVVGRDTTFIGPEPEDGGAIEDLAFVVDIEQVSENLFGLALKTPVGSYRFCTIDKDLEYGEVKEVFDSGKEGLPLFFTTTGGEILFGENAFYLLLPSKSDEDKALAGNTTHFPSSLLLKFDLSGNLLWESKIAISQYADYSNDFHLWDNALYITGGHSHACISKECCYGNGAITKVNTATGTIEKVFTFNLSESIEEYNHMALLGNTVYVGGSTNWQRNEEDEWLFQGLFATIPFDQLK